MGYYKRLSTSRAKVKRYNASRRKATQLTNTPASGLIRLETVSETERFSMAQDADRLTAYNKAVEKWQDSVFRQLRAGIAGRSMRIARELEPRAYTDKYGIINRLGFSLLGMESTSTRAPAKVRVASSVPNGITSKKLMESR